jgi:hypothetical protein
MYNVSSLKVFENKIRKIKRRFERKRERKRSIFTVKTLNYIELSFPCMFYTNVSKLYDTNFHVQILNPLLPIDVFLRLFTPFWRPQIVPYLDPKHLFSFVKWC